ACRAQRHWLLARIFPLGGDALWPLPGRARAAVATARDRLRRHGGARQRPRCALQRVRPPDQLDRAAYPSVHAALQHPALDSRRAAAGASGAAALWRKPVIAKGVEIPLVRAAGKERASGCPLTLPSLCDGSPP